MNNQALFLEILKKSENLRTKKDWALYCHEHLLNELHEKDNEDWSSARILKDIYDCHTCVYHIAQVYVKGIIPAEKTSISGEMAFYGDKVVSKEDAILYIQRMLNPEKRNPPLPAPVPSIKKIFEKEIIQLKNPLILDVREEVVFKKILLNPRGISENLNQNIVLCCTRGYQSTICADLLIKAGFTNIYISTAESIHS